jgi:hypothetical protein
MAVRLKNYGAAGQLAPAGKPKFSAVIYRNTFETFEHIFAR